MSAVRNVWSDLVEKRLWPVAVVLVAMLVAVPVLLAKPAPATKAPAPVASAGPGPLVATPAAIGANADGGPVGGNYKNPFKQQHVPKATTGSSGGTSTGAAAPAASTGTGSTGGSSGGSSSGGSGSGGSGSTKPHSQPVTKLQIKFGPANGRRTTREIVVGTPLPSGGNPLIVFTEFGRNDADATFLISSDAQPQGDGKCKPTKAICGTLTMKPGDTEFFDVTTGSGAVQYQLDVLKVVKG